MKIAIMQTPLALAIAAVLGSTALLTTETAHATWLQSSTVSDVVTNNGDGTWTYDFTVSNTSTDDGYGGAIPIIIDWELPYFSDMGIVDIFSPSGWNWSIETINTPNEATGWNGDAAWQDPSDPWYQGADSPYTTGTEVLHWYCEIPDIFGGEGRCLSEENGIGLVILPGDSLSGFSFTADFSPTAAPYQASWASLPIQTGDPAFPVAGVGSPSVIGQVPEPASLALFGLGLFGLAAVRKKNIQSN